MTSQINNNYLLEPATSVDINWIALTEAHFYSAGDAVPEKVIRQWYENNPNGFFVLKERNGERIGHANLLPIREPTFGRFFNDEIMEKEITGKDLYAPSEKPLIKTLYIESIAIAQPPGILRAKAVVFLTCNFVNMVSNVSIPGNLEHLYAVAATLEGRHFLARLGFHIAKDSGARNDRHDLFAIKFMDLKKSITQICERLKF